MRTMMRRTLQATVLVLPLLAGGGCSVADVLSSDEILEELDEIVRIDGTGEARQVVYANEAMLSRDFRRLVLLAPIRTPLAWIFGRRSMQELKNPGYHVRELLRELPDETAGGWFTGPDLLTCAAAMTRFGWLGELDLNATTRVRSIDGLSRVSRQLGLTPFAGAFLELTTPLDATVAERARAGLRAAGPDARGESGALTAPEAYRDALAAITSQPLASFADRLVLVEDLGVLYAQERDPAARPWVRDALRAAMSHCVRGVLLRAIQGRSRRLAEVRLCAMEQIRRLGGPRTVPLMLATMAASPAERASGAAPFDSDSLVQLRLIHYCGQLDRELSETVVRLPGRQDWEATSPVEFLARTILSEQDYYSKLRTPAIVALTWCLGRETLDPDPAWVREWIDNRGS